MKLGRLQNGYLAAMLAAMAPHEPHSYRAPHGSMIKMLYICTDRTQNMLWRTILTNVSEFHLYYDDCVSAQSRGRNSRQFIFSGRQTRSGADAATAKRTLTNKRDSPDRAWKSVPAWLPLRPSTPEQLKDRRRHDEPLRAPSDWCQLISYASAHLSCDRRGVT